MTENDSLMDKIVSLCKRRGFVFQGSEIYGGLSGFWDYAHYGVLLKENIKKVWLNRFADSREDMLRFDSAIIMNKEVWQSSGHASGFADPMSECKKCKHTFRTDQLEDNKKCPDCKGELGSTKQFNMMFETNIGAEKGEATKSYLRPETAQGMFVNFKNVIDSFHPKLPFGLVQIGKAFRNEIAPRDFLFRAREFEQMEIEYFVRPNEWEKSFEDLRKETLAFFEDLGLDSNKVHELEVPQEKLAHYSKRTIDFEYDFPFGRQELSGLAYRTDFDLSSHGKGSSVSLEYLDEEAKEKIVPHVIEPSFGVDRLVLATLVNSYTEDEMNGEKRVYLKLSSKIAPVKVAVFPLLKNKPKLVEKALEIYKMLKKEMGSSTSQGVGTVEFDDNGNIGKRYRRQDEIGTPYCITVDFDSLEKGDVTVRDRDTGVQERVKIEDLVNKLK
ncbi:MAG: glycine--tRNA ligase [Candidatus Paceibacterota bacterium]|jgi:glycyl-tRNA synthetase